MRELAVSAQVSWTVALSVAVACTAPGSRPAPPSPQQACEVGVLPFIELRQRNWENAGLDVVVDSLGRYEVWTVEVGRRERAAAGELTETHQASLINRLRSSGYCRQPQDRDFLASPDVDWREYQLTVRTSGASQGVRFINVDPAVPRGMVVLAEHVTELGRSR